MLTAIKLLHTAIWAFLATSILALPVVGMLRRFRWAAILTAIVLVESVVLAVNGGRCPLSDFATRFTLNRRSNFDIYLPIWLAQYNKVVFGWLFVAGELVVVGCWLRQRFATSLRAVNRSSHEPTKKTSIMPEFKAGALYFVLVFAVGFVLGAIRTMWIVPRIGARRAELTETPIMLVVSIVAARWTVLRLAVSHMVSARIGMGCIALVLMLVAEFGLVLWMRGMSIRQYLAARDPVSGTVYYLLLAVFAIMPILVARR